VSLRPHIRPRADADIDEIADFYTQEAGAKSGIRFLDAVAAALAFILETPLAGAPRPLLNPRLTGLRSWPVPGFEDVRVYYLEPHGDVLEVVRILHGRRDLPRLFGDE